MRLTEPVENWQGFPLVQKAAEVLAVNLACQFPLNWEWAVAARWRLPLPRHPLHLQKPCRRFQPRQLLPRLRLPFRLPRGRRQRLLPRLP